MAGRRGDPCERLDRSATLTDVEEVEVVVAHHERATVRLGDTILRIDADRTRTDVEVVAMTMAPIPTPEVLRRPGRSLEEKVSSLDGTPRSDASAPVRSAGHVAKDLASEIFPGARFPGPTGWSWSGSTSTPWRH